MRFNKISLFLLILFYASPFVTAQSSDLEAQAEKYLNEGDKAKAVEYYGKAAVFYWNKNQTDKAITNFTKAFELNVQQNNKSALASIATNLGILYSDKEDYSNALTFFQKAFEIMKPFGRKTDLISALINIATTHQSLGEFDKAIVKAEEALHLAEEISDLKMMRKCYGTIAECYEKKGHSDKAFSYFEKFSAIDKKIKKAEMEDIKSTADNRVYQANVEKAEKEHQLRNTTNILQKTADSLEVAEKITREQQVEIDLRNAQLHEKEAQLKYEQYLRKSLVFGIIGIFIFVVMMSFMLWQKRRDNKLLKLKNEQIERQNKNITASIQYAQTIQQAILPIQSAMDKYIETFITYRPKDIVSGDFYWFSSMDMKNGMDTIFIAVADCTGHGVPGAFMSMIGSRLLNEIINEQGIKEPGEILTLLNQKLRSSLKQDKTENNDGMDICICRIQKNYAPERKVIFAGAKRPLFYYRQNTDKIEIIETEHKSIGGRSVAKENIEFSNREITLSKNDIIYLTSDGIIDQNGPDRKRFGTPRLLETLKKNVALPMNQQKEQLELTLSNFLGEEEQRDDITIMGIKLI